MCTPVYGDLPECVIGWLLVFIKRAEIFIFFCVAAVVVVLPVQLLRLRVLHR